ncbi:MAG: choice-of-anchor J domain-containing protein [Bacteroidetes bacterium]|nr:choice-of-anchor J domain-containing protein [Bacteroidota bacterium]
MRKISTLLAALLLPFWGWAQQPAQERNNFPAPRNLTAVDAGFKAQLNWQAPDLGGGGGGTVKLDEGFEGDFPPAGWVKLNPDGGTGWTSLNAGTTPIPGWQGGTATPAPEGGSKMAFCTWNTGGTTANDQWIVTPQITVENGDQLRFYVRYAFSSYNDNFDVRISTTSQNDPAAFTTVVAEMNFHLYHHHRMAADELQPDRLRACRQPDLHRLP